MILAHLHLNNTNTDGDGGMDDPSSNHVSGANHLYGDGSVRYLRNVPTDNGTLSTPFKLAGTYTADGVNYQAMGTRAGGEVVSPGLDY